MAARRLALLLCAALADDATVSVLLDINGAKQPLVIPTRGAVDATRTNIPYISEARHFRAFENRVAPFMTTTMSLSFGRTPAAPSVCASSRKIFPRLTSRMRFGSLS